MFPYLSWYGFNLALSSWFYFIILASLNISIIISSSKSSRSSSLSAFYPIYCLEGRLSFNLISLFLIFLSLFSPTSTLLTFYLAYLASFLYCFKILWWALSYSSTSSSSSSKKESSKIARKRFNKIKFPRKIQTIQYIQFIKFIPYDCP